MTEALTESFCERCGTRYSFTAPPKPKTFGKIRTLSRGLKSYVLSDASTLGDALTQAREDDHLRATGVQLDQFHDTFNFCMSCRQYTCATCWNQKASRCLSCEPVEGTTLAPIAVERPWIAPDPDHLLDAEAAARAAHSDAADWSPRAAIALDGPVETRAEIGAADEAAPIGEDSPSAYVAPTDEDTVDLAARLNFEAALAPEASLAARPDFQPRTAWARRLAEAPVPVPADPEEFQTLLAQIEEELDAAERDSIGSEASPSDAAALVADVAAMPIDASGDVGLEAVPGELAPDVSAGEAVPDAAALVADGTAMPIDASNDVAAGADGLGVGEWPGAVVADPEAVGDAPIGIAGETDGLAAAAAHATSDAVDDAVGDAPIGIAAESDGLEVAIDGAAQAGDGDAGDAPIGIAAEDGDQAGAAAPVWWIVAPDGSGLGVDHAVQPTWPAADVPSGSPMPLPSVPTVKHPPAQPPRRIPPPVPANGVWPTLPASAAPTQPAQQRGRAAGNDSLWAASSREVASRAGSNVQACRQCGLALSAAARFCRRCGTSQH